MSSSFLKHTHLMASATVPSSIFFQLFWSILLGPNIHSSLALQCWSALWSYTLLFSCWRPLRLPLFPLYVDWCLWNLIFIQVYLLNLWTHISICLLYIFIWILDRDFKPSISLMELISFYLLPKFACSSIPYFHEWHHHEPICQSNNSDVALDSFLSLTPATGPWSSLPLKCIPVNAHCWIITIPDNCLFSFYSLPLPSFLSSVFTMTSINFISNEVTSRTVLKHWLLTHLVKSWALFVFYMHISPPSSVKFCFPSQNLSHICTQALVIWIWDKLRSILSIQFSTRGQFGKDLYHINMIQLRVCN